jgi:hypothetical protein
LDLRRMGMFSLHAICTPRRVSSNNTMTCDVNAAFLAIHGPWHSFASCVQPACGSRLTTL